MACYKYLFLIGFICGSCATQNIELINNSNSALITQNHFEECITSLQYSALLDQRIRKEKVYFEYFPEVKSSSDCDGIYYYRYVLKSMPQVLYRDTNGRTYSKYFIFLVINGDLIPLHNATAQKREKLFESNKRRLEKKFGAEKIAQLKDALLDGYKNFY